jgi:hypothetical protein
MTTKKKKKFQPPGKRRPGNPNRVLRTPELEDAIYRFYLEAQPKNDETVARAFGISMNTFYRWQRESPRLRAFVEEARDIRDDLLVDAAERSLQKLVQGGKKRKKKWVIGEDGKKRLVAVETETFLPDLGAISKVLNNRASDRWKDKQEIEHSGGLLVQVVDYANTPDPDDHAAAQLPPAAVPAPAAKSA